MINLDEFLNNCEKQLNKSNSFSLEEARNAYRGNGIYVFYLNNEPIYVGSARNIRTRLTHHKNRNGSALYEKMEDYWVFHPAEHIVDLCKIKCLQVPVGRVELEEHLISKYNPMFNNYKIKKRKGEIKKKLTTIKTTDIIQIQIEH